MKWENENNCFWPCPNHCENWVRDDIRFSNVGLLLVTNHHPRCEYVDASLIDVWKVTDGQTFYYDDNKESAFDAIAKDKGLMAIKEKMHREVYNNLNEFSGF